MAARGIFAVALTVAVSAAAHLVPSSADAQEPPKPVSRDLIRRYLLDRCVYTEAAREGSVKERVVDACQCASSRAVKDIKEDDVEAVRATSKLPDEWVQTTMGALEACSK